MAHPSYQKQMDSNMEALRQMAARVRARMTPQELEAAKRRMQAQIRSNRAPAGIHQASPSGSAPPDGTVNTDGLQYHGVSPDAGGGPTVTRSAPQVAGAGPDMGARSLAEFLHGVSLRQAPQHTGDLGQRLNPLLSAFLSDPLRMAPGSPGGGLVTAEHGPREGLVYKPVTIDGQDYHLYVDRVTGKRQLVKA